MVQHTIPARRGVAAIVRATQTIRIINTHGNQVVDTWAFAMPSCAAEQLSARHDSRFPVEYMSMSHCRTAWSSLVPQVGSMMVSNRRRPLLTLVKDSSPGIHDTLIASCDIYRYQQLIPDLKSDGGYHDNCCDNLHASLGQAAALAEQLSDRSGLAELVENLRGWTPDPYNLFMNIPWHGDGKITWEQPRSKPGDLVEFRAERDTVVAMSACPQDVTAINAGTPVDAHFEIF